MSSAETRSHELSGQALELVQPLPAGPELVSFLQQTSRPPHHSSGGLTSCCVVALSSHTFKAASCKSCSTLFELVRSSERVEGCSDITTLLSGSDQWNSKGHQELPIKHVLEAPPLLFKSPGGGGAPESEQKIRSTWFHGAERGAA